LGTTAEVASFLRLKRKRRRKIILCCGKMKDYMEK